MLSSGFLNQCVGFAVLGVGCWVLGFQFGVLGVGFKFRAKGLGVLQNRREMKVHRECVLIANCA